MEYMFTDKQLEVMILRNYRYDRHLTWNNLFYSQMADSRWRSYHLWT